ncbi:MAG TPA: undecaprenyl-diphosphatase UppP [Candidatus Binataceae bacterium]|nr:undecaprenyl-diphosphatase UppP [Candidatus Binataceae bacterium]
MLSNPQAIVLGIVQGLTEFLPVSSSAHLVIIPWLLNWEDPGLAFDVALHLGTLLALLIYYWRDWLDMGLSLASGQQMPRRLLMLLIIASVPGAIIGVLFEKEAETIFRTPALIACTLAIMGIVLWLADIYSTDKRKVRQMTVVDAFLIGLSQALAIVPGVSRSGATITMARLLGLAREDAANFSFLMATPIIAGAGMLELHKALKGGLTSQLGLGFLASAFFGILSIALLIRYVRTHTYRPFAIYRIIAGVIVILVALTIR